MKRRRTFSLLEMMLAIVIVGESIELGKMIHECRTLVWEFVGPAQMDAWLHPDTSAANSTGPVAPVAGDGNTVV
jgi:hypothetical protein